MIIKDYSVERCTITNTENGEVEVYAPDSPPVKAGLDRVFHWMAGLGEPWWATYDWAGQE